jgi:hypothetical protein
MNCERCDLLEQLVDELEVAYYHQDSQHIAKLHHELDKCVCNGKYTCSYVKEQARSLPGLPY